MTDAQFSAEVEESYECFLFLRFFLDLSFLDFFDLLEIFGLEIISFEIWKTVSVFS